MACRTFFIVVLFGGGSWPYWKILLFNSFFNPFLDIILSFPIPYSPPTSFLVTTCFDKIFAGLSWISAEHGSLGWILVMFVMVISSTRRYARSRIRLALWFLIIKKDFVELPVIEASTRLDTTLAIVFMMVLNKKTCEERDRSVQQSREENVRATPRLRCCCSPTCWADSTVSTPAQSPLVWEEEECFLVNLDSYQRCHIVRPSGQCSWSVSRVCNR